MTTTAKRKKLHYFVDSADDQQVRSLYNKIDGFFMGNPDTSGSLTKMERLEVMKQASNSPLFLADMMEISGGFNVWEDEGFLKELKSPIDDIESGKVEGIPWEEVKQKARERLAFKNKKS